MYSSKELTDIQARVAKGWHIRRDEIEALIKMAQELVRMRERALAPATMMPAYDVTYIDASTEEQIRAVIKSWSSK